ncbi:PhlB family protein [Mycobacterium sp. ML4]
MAASRHPSLHSPARAGERVALHGSRCARCGFLALPPEALGCRRCGAPAAEHEPLTLDGSALVRVCTIVHSDPMGTIPTPYTLARLALDAPGGQPLVADGLLAGGPVETGSRVQARLVELGEDRLEVRFAAESEEP